MTLKCIDGTQASNADPDREMQYALGTLLTNPSLLIRLHKREHTQADDFPPVVMTKIDTLLHQQGDRIALLATLLDERLCRNVLRFLPLSSSVMPQPMIKKQWQDFRRDTEGARWDNHRGCALSFCEHMLKNSQSFVLETRRCLDVVRYENAILAMDSRLRTVGEDDVSDFNYNSKGFPAVLVTCLVLKFDWAVADAVKTIRAASGVQYADELDLRTLSAARSTPETLLFYTSWLDRQVKTMRIGPNLLGLLKACDGTTTLAALIEQREDSDLAGISGKGLQSAVKQFHEIGLLRSLANPDFHQSYQSVSLS